MLGDELGTEFCWPKEKKSKYRIAFYSISEVPFPKDMNKAMNFNLFQSRDSRRFFSRVSVLPELKYIFICRLRDGVVPAVILLSE